MIDTVRAFAVKWLLEPTKKTPPTPSKRIIRFVTAWLAPPNKFDVNIDCDWQAWKRSPSNMDEYELAYHDNLSMSQGNILGIKIYDDNRYMGAFAGVMVEQYYISCVLKGRDGQKKCKVICDYSPRAQYDVLASETVSYSAVTQLGKASEWQKSRSVYKDCPFEISPNIYGSYTGAAFTPYNHANASGYSRYDVKKYECNIKTANVSSPIITVKPSETYIGLKYTFNINETWELVNLKNDANEWVSGSETVNQTRTRESGHGIAIDDKHIKPDLSTAEIKIEYDENGEEISTEGFGEYVAYYDGLTPEIMSEYAAIARSYDGSKIEVIMDTEI